MIRERQRSLADAISYSKQSSLTKHAKYKQNLKILVPPNKQDLNTHQQMMDERNNDNRILDSIKMKHDLRNDMFIPINQMDSQNQILSPENIVTENKIQFIDTQTLTDKSFIKMLSQGYQKAHNYNNLTVNFESERGRALSDFNNNHQNCDNMQLATQMPSVSKIKLHQVHHDTLSPVQLSIDKYHRMNNTEKNSFMNATASLWFSDFERAKNYSIYFPHNNCEKVLTLYKKMQLMNLSRKKKKRQKLKPQSSKVITHTIEKSSKQKLSLVPNLSNKQSFDSFRKNDKF